MSEVSKYKKIIAAIGVFLFISPNLNVPECILSYCGISSHDTVRLVSVIIFAVLDLLLLLASIKEKPSLKMYAIVIIFNAVYVFPHLINRDMTAVMQYGLFVVPATVFAIMLSREDDIKEVFMRYMKAVNWVIAAVAVLYIVLMFSGACRNEEGLFTIQNMSYGDMAYLFMRGFVVSLICCLEKKSPLPYICIVIFTSAIVFAGARSAILCVFCTLFLCLLIQIISKEGKRAILITVIVSLITTATAAGCLFILPEGSRLDAIHVDVTSSDFSAETILPETKTTKAKVLKVIYVPTGEKKKIYKIYEEEILNNDCPKSETEEKLRDDVKSGRNEYIQLIDEEDRSRVEKYFIRMNRDYLWKTAYAEFKKNKIFGNGICYFKNKYDGYFPHNVFLEAMVDYGIVGLVLFTALGAYCFIRGIRYYLKSGNKNVFWLFLLLFSHLPRYLLYTTIYSNTTLAVTVILFVTLGRLKEKENEIPATAEQI